MSTRSPNILSLALIGVLSFAPAAISQEWERAGIRSQGFEFDLPPLFVPTEEEAENGAVFAGPRGATLAVGGSSLDDRGFRSTVRRQMAADEAEGLDVTYERITPTWASYSGFMGDQIRYVRAIAVCGRRIAVFVLDYDRAEKEDYDPLVERMVRSMKVSNC